MKITLLASFLVMAAYFLLLYAGVGLIQEKKSSPPRRVRSSPPFLREKPSASAARISSAGASASWRCCCFSVRQSSPRGTAFGTVSPSAAFFARYLVILYVMEAYDILFFDWVLLCHSNFFPRFYPEVKGIVGRTCLAITKKRILCIFFFTSPIRRPRVGLHAFLRGNFTSKLNRTRRCTR